MMEAKSNLNGLFRRLIDYFIDLNNSFANEERKNSLENHNFCICSILMRRICSSQGFNAENEAQDQSEQINYFNLLLNFCLKHHKSKVKEIKANSNGKITLSSFHVDFLKALIFYSSKLNGKYDMKIDCVKYCEAFFSIYINFDLSTFDFDLNYLSKFKLDNNEEEEELNESGLANQKEILAYLTRGLCVSINTLNVEQFKLALDSFESRMFENMKKNDSQSNNNFLINLAHLVKYLSSDFELDEKLKPEFSVFIQKFLVQIHPICFSLISSSETACLGELLNAQYLICSSKYVSLDFWRLF